MTTKVLGVALLLAIAGCSDLDRAIEDKANEVLGTKDEETTQTAAVPPATPAPTPQPAAAPEVAPVPEPPPAAEPAAVPAPAVVPERAPAKPGSSVADKPKTSVPKPSTPAKPVEAAEPAPSPAPVAAEKPEAPAPKPVEVKEAEAPAAKPASKVTLPKLKHVKVSMPARVQELLDADPRMQPWLNSTLATIETCYEGVLASDPSASGTIKFVLEMHANARPDADITSLPPQLSGVVACGTGKLMRAARMPLFTGKEGEKHTVSVKLSP